MSPFVSWEGMLVTYVGLFAAPDGSSDLRANCKDTGFVASYGVGLLLGHMVLLDLSALGGGACCITVQWASSKLDPFLRTESGPALQQTPAHDLSCLFCDTSGSVLMGTNRLLARSIRCLVDPKAIRMIRESDSYQSKKGHAGFCFYETAVAD